jgi:hypothetical protein
MFFAPTAWRRRVRNRVVGLVPNHWVLLRSPVTVVGDEVRFAFWSWGGVHMAGLPRSTFERGYHGALRGLGNVLAAPAGAT